jgi:hypothetical protein
MVLAASNTLWREALSILVKRIESELGAKVKVRPSAMAISA